MGLKFVPEGYLKVEFNGRGTLENYVPCDKVTTHVLKGKDFVRDLDRIFRGRVINDLVLKLNGDTEYIHCSLFHTRGHAPGVYKLLDDDFNIKDSVTLSDISEIYVKNPKK